MTTRSTSKLKFEINAIKETDKSETSSKRILPLRAFKRNSICFVLVCFCLFVYQQGQMGNVRRLFLKWQEESIGVKKKKR